MQAARRRASSIGSGITWLLKPQSRHMIVVSGSQFLGANSQSREQRYENRMLTCWQVEQGMVKTITSGNCKPSTPTLAVEKCALCASDGLALNEEVVAAIAVQDPNPTFSAIHGPNRMNSELTDEEEKGFEVAISCFLAVRTIGIGVTICMTLKC